MQHKRNCIKENKFQAHWKCAKNINSLFKVQPRQSFISNKTIQVYTPASPLGRRWKISSNHPFIGNPSCIRIYLTTCLPIFKTIASINSCFWWEWLDFIIQCVHVHWSVGKPDFPILPVTVKSNYKSQRNPIQKSNKQYMRI